MIVDVVVQFYCCYNLVVFFVLVYGEIYNNVFETKKNTKLY